MKDDIEYKKLWFELSKEKEELQREVFRLEKSNKYLCHEADKFEKWYNELLKEKWNRNRKYPEAPKDEHRLACAEVEQPKIIICGEKMMSDNTCEGCIFAVVDGFYVGCLNPDNCEYQEGDL